MSIAFFHSNEPFKTLEDETFHILEERNPQSIRCDWQMMSIRNIRSFLSQHNPSLIISRRYIPRYISTQNLILTSSLPNLPLSRLLRSNISILSHSPQKTKHRQYIIPPLLHKCILKHEKPRCFVSLGPFHASSNHHLALDAYATLPKRIRARHELYFCGTKVSQEDIDRLKLHGYGLSIHFVHDPVQTRNLLSHADIVFRLGDSSQKNLPIDRAVLEHNHHAIHLKNTPRTYLYSQQTRIKSADPHHIKTLVQNILRNDFTDFSSPFDAQTTYSKYTFLIESLQRK